ncbi:MAG: response regulator [Patescibacteria group bacterium]
MSTPEQQEPKHKILLIEDDKFLIKLYSDKLTREGFEVSMAITGEEGLSKVKSEKPELILLDVILPQKNGFDILSALKLDSTTKSIPVVMLTNLGQESDVKTGLELGAVDYLVKTDFSITRLPEVVRKHIALHTKKGK